jgi:hypothetical protein
MDITTLTLVHTGLSFLALAFGIVALRSYFSATPALWTNVFLVLDILVVVTGFFFPFKGFTPAFGTGIAASVILIAMLIGRFVFGLAGVWRKIYAVGLVANVFFLGLVTIAQSFLKLPPLHELAPNGSEPPFAIAQLINLAIFLWVGWKMWPKTNAI